MDRNAFLGELSSIVGRWPCPWVIGEDFNIIRFSSERKGGCPISTDMWAFPDWIRHHELIDLPLDGAHYNWSNCQEDPIMSRLVRFLVSPSWVELFPDCIQKAIPRPISDNCPISLVTGLVDWGPPPFWLEIMWLKEKPFLEGVPGWWRDISTEGWMGFLLFQKLKELRKRINF